MCLDSIFVRGNRLVRREFCDKHNGSGSRIKVGLIFLAVLAILYAWELLPDFLFPRAIKSKESSPSSSSLNIKGHDRRGLPLQLTSHHVKSLDKINRELEQMSLNQVLAWAHAAMPNANDKDKKRKEGQGQLVHVTSFGASGMVILHALDQMDLTPPVPVITIDTLHLFPETYDFIQRLQEETTNFRHPVNVSTWKPKAHSTSRQDFDVVHGNDFYKTNYEQYSYLTKIEPTARALEQHRAKVWITGRRRSQGGERSKLRILEVDEMTTHDNAKGPTSTDLRFKLNPLAYWTYAQVWDYIRKHKVPYNPLHDKGYKSIGDTMTTQPVDAKAEERSGRFVDLRQKEGEKSECGMHSIRAKALAAQKVLAVQAEMGPTGKSSLSQEEEVDDNPFNDGDEKKKKKKKKGETDELPCTGCLELNPRTLTELIDIGTTDVLLEFHSPLCGHCRNFAPKYEKVALQLLEHASIDVARFDMTYQSIPQKAKDLGITVPSTPAVFLLTRLPELKVKRYKGLQQTPSAIIEWLKKNLDYIG